jgi:hypothetical protein
MIRSARPFAAASAAALALAGAGFASVTSSRGNAGRDSVAPPPRCFEDRCYESNGNHFGWGQGNGQSQEHGAGQHQGPSSGPGNGHG